MNKSDLEELTLTKLLLLYRATFDERLPRHMYCNLSRYGKWELKRATDYILRTGQIFFPEPAAHKLKRLCKENKVTNHKELIEVLKKEVL